MDSQHNISLVNVAQLVILNAVSPMMADASDEGTKYPRHHQHGYVQPVSRSRADYPVIWDWLPSPDESSNSITPAQ